MTGNAKREPSLTLGTPEPIGAANAYLDWAAFLAGADPQRAGGAVGASAIPISVTSALDFDAFVKRVQSDPLLRFDPVDRILNFAGYDKTPRTIEAVLYVLSGPLDRDFYDIVHVGGPIPVSVTGPGPDLSALPQIPSIPETPTVIFGVIDDGLGFLNARFRTYDPATNSFSSRFAGVWLQPSLTGALPGTVLDRAAINMRIGQTRRRAEGKVYADINAGLFPPGTTRSVERRRSHGSHVADLLAGAPPQPAGGHRLHEAPIIGVQLPPEVFNDTTGKHLDPWVLAGLRWMIATARVNGIPRLVVNVSLGFLAGAKDGSGFIEQAVARLVDQARLPIGGKAVEVHVVYAYGNDYENRQVARLAPEPEAPADILLRVQRDDYTPSYVEIRPHDKSTELDVLDALRVGLTLPAGQTLAPFDTPVGTFRTVLLNGVAIARVYHFAEVPVPGGDPIRAHLVLAIRQSAASPPNDPTLLPTGWRETAPAGGWRLQLATERKGDNTVSLQVQRDDSAVGYLRRGRQAYFEDDLSYERDLRTHGDRDYSRLCAQSRVRYEGTDSALASRIGDGLHAVGAARVDPWPFVPGSGVRPARYASHGAEWSRLQPTASAVSETTAAFRGVLASGTVSGSAVRLDGSSVAAPTYGRDLVIGALTRVPNPVPPERLGAFTIVWSDAIRG